MQPQPAQAGQADEDEGGDPAEAAAAGGAASVGSSSTAITHLAPPGLRRFLEHSTKAFPLAFSLFETFLGAKFPYPSLHQVLCHIPPLSSLFSGKHSWLSIRRQDSTGHSSETAVHDMPHYLLLTKGPT